MSKVDDLIEKYVGKVVTLMKEYTDLLSTFTNKIKTINKNGKFVTENEG